MCSLEEQRLKMFKNFTRHCLRNEKFKHWFMRTDQEDREGVSTRQEKPTYKPVHTRTRAYARSAIPQMVNIANKLRPQNTMTEIVLKSGQILVV